MRFDAAWYLWLIPPSALYLLWLSLRSYAHLARWASWAGFTARVCIVVALVAALAQPAVRRQTTQGHLVIAVDVSKSITKENSTAAIEAIEKIIADTNKSKRLSRVSLIAFGADAELLYTGPLKEDFLSEELRDYLRWQQRIVALDAQRVAFIGDGTDAEALAKLDETHRKLTAFGTRVVRDETDLEAALRLALNCGALGEARTIYLLSDANFNRGQTHAAFRTAKEQAAQLNFIALDLPQPPEVACARLTVPNSLRVDQTFTAEIRIASTIATDAVLRVFRDGYAAAERSIKLKVGENIFPIDNLSFREKGFHFVEAIIRAEQDTRLENNTVRALAYVPGEARVLYVEGDEEQIPYLRGALELEGMKVEARSAAGVPQNLAELLSFDAFILSNVPSERITRRQMDMIQTYVRDFGGGFLMLGGDESFGLGGYFKTPIEEILPVRMPIQKDMMRPSLALALVIDKSGSMEGVKIQLAKRAAVATAEAINPRDQIAVIGFDGQARVLLELTAAADRATIQSHIAMLDAGGGTFLFPALEAAHHRLLESNARRKHVIVLSDGQTQGFGYEDYVSGMSADGITLSAIGIGEGADMQLMETIALAGGGRTYFTNDFYSIPQIFTREALRASRNMLVERLVQPMGVGYDKAVEGIDLDDLPLLTGYVATTPKPSANTIIISDTGDPILAIWRYGLGQTVAFTSEPKPRWAEDWLAWEDFARFWSQLVRGVSGRELGRDVAIEADRRTEGDKVVLTADVRSAAGEFLNDVDLTATSVNATGVAEQLPVSRVGAGLFEAEIPETKFGENRQFVWRATRNNEEVAVAPYAFVESYSPEFAELEFNRAAIAEIEAESLGVISSVRAPSFVRNEHRSTSEVELWPYLLACALIIAPFDILIRRLG